MDKKSLPVLKITYLDRASSLESKNIWLLRSYGRLLGTKSHFRLSKIAYLDRVSGLESKNIWLLRSYGRLLGTKSHFRL